MIIGGGWENMYKGKDMKEKIVIMPRKDLSKQRLEGRANEGRVEQK